MTVKDVRKCPPTSKWNKLAKRNAFAAWTVLVALLLLPAAWAQSWTFLNNGTPFSPNVALLLTDGTVMVQQYQTGNWFRLTPDATGSYVNGTWSQLASMPAGHAPLYYASAVLPDGRVVAIGGEYNNGSLVESSLGSIYDPRTNSWISIAPPSGVQFGDASSVVLANGTLMVGTCCSASQYLLNASNLTWTLTGRGKADSNSEESWTLLPSGRVLTVDTENGLNSETYNPRKGKWVSAGSTIVQLTSNGGLGIVPEIGPAVLRPDGTVFATGATSNTAIYDSNTGFWSVGPTFPGGLDIADGPAALLPSGNVLVDTSPGIFNFGTQFFEFNGSNLLSVPSPANASFHSSFEGRMLVLPTGQVLFTDGSNAQIYTPVGTFQSRWQPTISSVASTLDPGSTNNVISGTQFNGLSEGAMYGDDAQAATNYPLVRITNNATSHVFYARTHDHSTMGVATGSTQVSTQFDVPSDIELGASTLQVVANGIPSAVVPVNIGSAPPPNYVGFVDHMGCDTIVGWAADRNRLNTSINVEFYDGSTLIATVLANLSRPDVGQFLGDNGLHGFTVTTPTSLQDGLTHTVHVKFETSRTELSNSPASLTCASMGSGTMQGMKVDANLALFNSPGATITLDTGASFGPTVNPYSATVSSGAHVVTSSIPAGFNVAYSACVNCTDHTAAGGHPFVAGNSATVSVPTNGYVDLWWQYTSSGGGITNTVTETCGQVNPGNVSVSCDPSFDFQGSNYDETIMTNRSQGDSYQVRLFNIDDHESIYVNGNLVQTANYSQDVTVDLTPFMTVGTNTIRFTELNDAGPWTYGYSRIRTLAAASTTFFNESCGQVVPGGVTVSCDATNARRERVGTNFNQTLTAPFATGDTYSVHLFNVDDRESVYVNSTLVATANYGDDITFDLTPFMTVGNNNTIILTEANDAGPWSYGFTVIRVPGH